MTQEKFRHVLRRLDLTQVRAAELLHVDARTVRRWASGERKVPGPVVAALEGWLERQRMSKPIRFSNTFTGRPVPEHYSNPRRRGRHIMARNERTSPKVAKVAAKVLKTGKATPKQAKTLAGSALTQAPDKGKGKKK